MKLEDEAAEEVRTTTILDYIVRTDTIQPGDDFAQRKMADGLVERLVTTKKREGVERLKNFSDFAEQNLDGEAGKFFGALSSAFKLIAPKRNPSI